MMWIVSIAGLALAAALCAVALKKHTPETAVVLAVLSGALVLLTVLSKLSPLIGTLQRLMSATSLPAACGEILLKTIGICFLCQFTADACRDAGQAGLASKVELAAKLAVILLALPLFNNLLDLAAGLLQG